MNLVLGFLVLWSIITINSAIVTSPSTHDSNSEVVRKEKRGILGYGVHGHHQHYAPHYDEFAPYHHNNPVGPVSPPLPPPHPVNLGALAHTTVVRKVGIPVPVPYPVKVTVPIYKPYPVPVDRPFPVPHYVPHPVGIAPHQLPLHGFSHHHNHPWPHKW